MENKDVIAKVAEALKSLVGKQCSVMYRENSDIIDNVVFPASQGLLKTRYYDLTDWYVTNHSMLIYRSEDNSYRLQIKYSKKLKDDPNLLARDPNRYVFKSFTVSYYDVTEGKWITFDLK